MSLHLLTPGAEVCWGGGDDIMDTVYTTHGFPELREGGELQNMTRCQCCDQDCPGRHLRKSQRLRNGFTNTNTYTHPLHVRWKLRYELNYLATFILLYKIFKGVNRADECF